jgi:hypothetical protein
VILVLIDKSEIIISTREAEKITESLIREPKGFIILQGQPINKAGILRIKNGGHQEKIEKRIEPPDYRGKHSENKEKIRSMLRDRGLAVN